MYIRPLLEYCSEVFNSSSRGMSNEIEGVQRYYTRCVLIKCRRESAPYVERLKIFGLESLERRREISDLAMVHKVLNRIVDIDRQFLFNLPPPRSRRRHDKQLHQFPARSLKYRQFLSNRVVSKWNSLSKEVVSSPTSRAFHLSIRNTTVN